MQWVKYGSTQGIVFALIDPTTGNHLTDTDYSAATVKAECSVGKNTSAASAASGSVQYLGDGFWLYTPTATETQCGLLRFSVNDSHDPKRWMDDGVPVVTHSDASSWLTGFQVDVTRIFSSDSAAQNLYDMYATHVRAVTVVTDWASGLTGTTDLVPADNDLAGRAMVSIGPNNIYVTPRRIVANTGATITVDAAWPTAPQTGDSFLLLGLVG